MILILKSVFNCLNNDAKDAAFSKYKVLRIKITAIKKINAIIKFPSYLSSINSCSMQDLWIAKELLKYMVINMLVKSSLWGSNSCLKNK